MEGLHLKRLEAEAINSSPETVYCPLCKDTKRVLRQKKGSTFWLECGHIAYRLSGRWNIK